jgi:hypothetical protein
MSAKMRAALSPQKNAESLVMVPGPMGCRQYIDLLDNLREMPDLSDLQMK